MKHIYTLLALVAMCFTPSLHAAEMEPEMVAEPEMEAPAAMDFMDDHDGVETEIGGITIALNGSQLRISNANGETLEIYNLAGVRVTLVRIDSDEKTVALNLKKGCYMIKIGKFVRKISIR